MKEVVCVHIGQCGNSIGSQFWELIGTDHGISPIGSYVGSNPDQLDMISVYFNETKELVFTPRSVMIDLDKTSMKTVRSSPYGQIFNDKNFLFGSGGTGNNWAKGHFSEGAQLCHRSLNVIRKEVEGCDCFNGFQIAHSIGGGTGAGLGSLLLSKLKDEYPCRVISIYSVIPSPKVSSCMVEPYNAVLAFNHLIESTHHTFCIDNDALYEIASQALKIDQTSYNHLNYMVSLAMSGITTCMRFSGPSSSSLRKISVNMVPFPRLHFFVPGFAPLICNANKAYKKFSVAEIANDVFAFKNLFAACDPKQGKFLTAACIFRGDLTAREVERQVSNFQNRDSEHYVEWIPDNIKTAICTVPLPEMSKTATFIGNTTSIQVVTNRVREQYLSMFRRKAFLHWFTAEGMDEMEFSLAEANLNDLTAEYHEYEIAKTEEFQFKCSDYYGKDKESTNPAADTQ